MPSSPTYPRIECSVDGCRPSATRFVDTLGMLDSARHQMALL